MKNKKNYLLEEPHGTTDGFWYDISDGGYIKPEEFLVDQERAKELKQAINLLKDWYDEMIDDGAIIEY